MTRKMPPQKPGKSKQDYETPKDFLSVVQRRFGLITIDLAASKDNAVTPLFFTDAFNNDWGYEIGNGTAWLNPPFADIKRFIKQCAFAQTDLSPWGTIVVLTPASVGSNWFRDYVWGKAAVYALNGRITFVGETSPYPKDCMLSVYNAWPMTHFEVWNWRENA